ncbi:MAG: otopetrin domain-containing protein [Clostridiales bacterium]|nr:otopetrin domain-containing protein [Clostridiales bacterium]
MGFFENENTKIGVEEWETGFQNVEEIIDVYQRDEAKIRQEVTEKHGDVSEGPILYWQAASRRALRKLSRNWWKAVIVAAVGSIVIDILSDQVSDRLLSLPGVIFKYLRTALSSPAECVMQFRSWLVSSLVSLMKFLFSLDFPFYVLTSALCTLIAVALGCVIIGLIRRKWPGASFDLDDIFTDKEVQARKEGLERIQTGDKQGH